MKWLSPSVTSSTMTHDLISIFQPLFVITSDNEWFREAILSLFCIILYFNIKYFISIFFEFVLWSVHNWNSFRTDGERYRSGTGVALCSMAAADLCSLLLILAQNIMQITPQIDSDTIFMSVVCKVSKFLSNFFIHSFHKFTRLPNGTKSWWENDWIINLVSYLCKEFFAII